MTLRLRLLAAMGVVALVLGLAALVVTRNTQAHLVEQVDAQLERIPPGMVPNAPSAPDADAASASDSTGDDRDDQADSAGLPERMPPGSADELAERRESQLSKVWTGRVGADGTVEELTVPNLDAADPPRPALDGDEVLAAPDDEPFTVGSSDPDVRYRVVTRPAPDGDGVLVVAMSLADVDDAVERLVMVEVAALAGVLAVLGLVTWWVIRLGVRPLKAMTATATAIAGGDLSRRVPEVASGTEAGDLGAALNLMMANIETTFDERVRAEQRLRQFAADASHELRTPVATIRGYAELFRRGGLDDPTELREALRRTEDEAVRMGSLIDDLLHLARTDDGQPLVREPVDLAALVDDAVRDLAAVQPERPVTTTVDGPITVLGDEGRLRQVVGNLLGNVAVHTPVEAPVEVRLTGPEAGADSRVILEVVDQGPGMGAETASRAFERFYRADPSRSRHHGGSGLGLAIVDATMKAHGGTVTLHSTPGAGTTVRVEVPAANG